MLRIRLLVVVLKKYFSQLLALATSPKRNTEGVLEAGGSMAVRYFRTGRVGWRHILVVPALKLHNIAT